VATWLNDPIVLNLSAYSTSTLPNQPLLPGTTGSGTPAISNEVPADGSTVPPPLTLIEVLVN
jgi:hypothetical protein